MSSVPRPVPPSVPAAAPVSPGRRRAVLGAAGIAGIGAIAPAIVRAQPARVVRIGSPDLGTAGKSTTGAGPLAIVHANKWLEEAFSREGVAIEWHFFRGAGPAIHEALSARQLDLVYLGDLAAVIGRSRGLATRYVAPLGRGSHSYLAVAPGVPIRSVEDLRGRKVSVLKGTAYQRPFDALLASAGMTERDLKVINMDWPSSKAAVVSGQIDATFGGADLHLLRDKGVQIAVSTKGRGPSFGILSGLLATEAFVQTQPQALQRIVREVVRASHWASQEANRELFIRLLADNSGNPQLAYRAEFEGEELAPRFSPWIDDGLVAGYQAVLDDGLKSGLVRQGFDVKAWFEPGFVQQAVRELGLERQWKPLDAQGRARA